MNRVTKAIIMAAGKGERMRPVTLTIPKPLIYVNGKRMIDTIIEALHKNGIFEIYVVVGYLKEAFMNLPNEIEGLRLIENPYYTSCNNISSLYVARNHIGSAMIIDGDQMITDSSILSPYFVHSGYNCVRQESDTREWMLQLDENNRIVACNRMGGSHAWQLFGISRWTDADGVQLKSLLELEFEVNKDHRIYWDDVAMFKHFDKFVLQGYPMTAGSVMEIDSFEELMAVDHHYCTYKEKNL